MPFSTTLALALLASTFAANVNAVPASSVITKPTSTHTTLSAPTARTTNFGIVFMRPGIYDGYLLRNRPLNSSRPRVQNLVFEKPSPASYLPSPVFLTGTEPPDHPSYLEFYGSSAADGLYGAVLPDVGHVSGNTKPVIARRHGGNEAFSLSAPDELGYQEIKGKLTATTNQFFACNTTVTKADGSKEKVVELKWGNDNRDGSLPVGCVTGRLIKTELPSS